MTELLDRLRPWYDERSAARVMAPAGQAGWPAGSFGDPIADVRSIVVHLTAGWPRRDSENTFVNRYINGQAPVGEGTQFYISGDGTVARLIDFPRRTWHATYVNAWALGAETGNLGNGSSPPGNHHWAQASGDAEDIPGAKLWIAGRTDVQTEVLPSWWTTATYAGPGRGVVGAGRMIFSEWQYRAWALLARYLLVDQGLPRNFPLLPHTVAANIVNNSVPFRRIVVADERADMMTRAFQAAPVNIQPVNFQAANAAALQGEYTAAIHPGVPPPTPGNPPTLKRHNRAWREFFDHYRGVHGHGFAGAIHNGASDKTECPGRLFDFHRLAREVWDWWWQPFDVGFRMDLGRESTAVDRRGYRVFRADTPLLEYYFDEDNTERAVRRRAGIHGNASSPATFTLDPASPVYAMAGGELVAARFPEPGPPPHVGVDLAFALVRHEVYHRRLFPNIVLGPFGPVPLPGSIDYGRAPVTVYTLYMHLGRPEGLSFEEVSDDNPDWLNRLLVRKRECDLGVSFHDDHPTHHGIPAAVWNNRPPGVPQRPTTLEAWRVDQAALTAFMTQLAAGEVVLAPRGAWTQSVKVLLGDFLGESGVIRNDAGTLTHGVRVETFSPSFVAPTFQLFTGMTGWSPPGPAQQPPCVFYPSEWARTPVGAERDGLEAIGVDVDLLDWWGVVALRQALDVTLSADARLPPVGQVFHYDPLDFAHWINTVTWASEWPKYEVTDAAGNPVTPAPARPRTRRV